MKPRILHRCFQAATVARASLAKRLRMWEFANHGRRHFRGDKRYDLQNVTAGFKSVMDSSIDDSKLLDRICAAYIQTREQEHFASDAYKVPEVWERVRERSLGPVIRALLNRDTETLGNMYRNLFRDTCSSGLLAPPNGMSKAYFGGEIKDMYRHFYLSHVLYRLDYWKTVTEGRFALSHLKGPGVGNPFGVVIDGTPISVGSEYAHYCAQRVGSLFRSDRTTVAEIRGGFGGIAYYLLRDHPAITYLNFDVPESIALSSYYLMKSFPRLDFLLYGEDEVTQETIDRANVVLMPLFEIQTMPAEIVDLTFSSYGLSTMSSERLGSYLERASTMTRDCLLYMNNERTSEVTKNVLCTEPSNFKLTDTRFSEWHSHKISGAGVGGAAALATSTTFEQCFVRSAADEILNS